MLPLIPALLFLLLNGAPNVERLAQDGRLPDAVSFANRPEVQALSARQSEAVLASLIAVSWDKELSHALICLLQFDSTQETRALASVYAEEKGSPSLPIRRDPPFRDPTQVVSASQRFRDGPPSIA